MNRYIPQKLLSKTARTLSIFLILFVLINIGSPLLGWVKKAKAFSPIEIHVDDLDAGYSETGTWTTSACGVGYGNGDTRYAADGTGDSTATWSFSVPVSGSYQVLASWSQHSNRAPTAEYTIISDSGPSPVIKNQTGPNCTWSDFQTLGTYNFTASDSYSVTLTNDSAGGYAIADAIRLVSVTVPTEVWVDDAWVANSPGDDLGGGLVFDYNAYATIQSAINDIVSGGTVHVNPHSTAYTENVVINKSLTLESSAGAIVNGGGGDALTITGSNVTITGLEIRNSVNGINVSNSNGHTISNNNIHTNATGISLNNVGAGINIAGNTLSGNTTSVRHNGGNDVDAQNNDWGGTTFQEIEPVVSHDCVQFRSNHGIPSLVCDAADDPTFGVVSYANPTGTVKSINFTSPTNGDQFATGTTSIHLAVDAYYDPYDVERVYFRYAPEGETCQQQYTSPFFNGLGNGTRTGNTFEIDWDITSVADGNYTVCALMHRNTGASSEGYRAENHAEVAITIDRTAPVVEITSHNTGNYINGVEEIRGSIADANPHHYWFVVHDASNNVIYGPGTVNFPQPQVFTDTVLEDPNNPEPWDTTTIPNGTYTIKLEARDALNNKDSTSIDWVTVYVDNTAPTSAVYIQGDLDETKDIVGTSGWHGYGWYERYDNVNLQISLGDTSNDFINYQVIPGDITCPAMGNAGYTAVTHDTNVNVDVNGTDGEYTLCYYAEDLAGNTEAFVHKQLLQIDDTAPDYTIDYSSIGGNDVLGVYYINTDTISVNVDVGDNLSGYTRARYDLYTADSSWICTSDHANQDNLLPPSTATTRTFTESGLADGRYCMRIWVYDDVQNKSWSDTNGKQWIYFVIDKTPPTLVLRDLFLDEIVTSIPRESDFVVEKSDNYTTGLSLICNPAITLDDLQLNPNVASKVMTINCSITDEALNETTASYTITVNNIHVEVNILDEGTTLRAIVTTGNPSYQYMWSGDCTPTINPAVVNKPTVPGNYTCEVTVTDEDGDTNGVSHLFSIPSPPPPPSPDGDTGGDGGTGGGTGLTGAAVVAGVRTVVAAQRAIDGDAAYIEIELDEEEEEEETLGAEQETCDVTSKVSGHVYLDKNTNDQRDDDEGIKGVLIEIFYEQNDQEVIAATAITDENGYWEAEVCPGYYKVRINKEDLPAKALLEDEEVLSLNVEEGKNLSDINFKVIQPDKAFNWQYCLVSLGMLGALLALWYFLSKKQDKKKYKV